MLRVSSQKNLQATIMYDCGGRCRKDILKNVLSSVRKMLPFESRTRKLDVMILSHLHDDHINGFDTLCNRGIIIDRLIIPHYNDSDFCILIGYLATKGATAKQINLIAQIIDDPSSWVSQRGVRQVIAISPDDFESDKELPAPPPDEPDLRGYEHLAIRREESSILNLYAQRVLGSDRGDGARKTADLVKVSNGIFLTLDPSKIGWGSIWMIVPFCQRNPPGRGGHHNVERYVEGVKEVLCKYNRDGRIVISGRGTERVLRQIKSLFRKYIGSQHATWNLLSVSAYMGFSLLPWRLIADVCKFSCGYFWMHSHEFPRNFIKSWILTGDTRIKQGCAWHTFYRKYLDGYFVFQIPHHGSRYNFDENIIRERNCFVFATANRNDPKHPHPNLLKRLSRIGLEPWIVTETPETALCTSTKIYMNLR